MLTENIVVNRHEALQLFREYRKHQHYSTPIDWEIQRTYQLMAQGRVIIKALDSIVKAGVGEDTYPKLAIVRATAQKCFLEYNFDGSARMSSTQRVRSDRHKRTYVDFPAGSFPATGRSRSVWARASALTPLVPINLRPKRGLDNYHILFEAVWQPAPPLDPLLLRRIGVADLWLVVAAWELTEVERAALAARV